MRAKQWNGRPHRNVLQHLLAARPTNKATRPNIWCNMNGYGEWRKRRQLPAPSPTGQVAEQLPRAPVNQGRGECPPTRSQQVRPRVGSTACCSYLHARFNKALCRKMQRKAPPRPWGARQNAAYCIVQYEPISASNAVAPQRAPAVWPSARRC